MSTTTDPFSGTSLRGYVMTTFDHVVQEFGLPGDTRDTDKCHVEWSVVSPHGPVTIYDYGPMRLCAEGCWIAPVGAVVQWHVGGLNDDATGWVASWLGVKEHRPFHRGCCEVDR